MPAVEERFNHGARLLRPRVNPHGVGSGLGLNNVTPLLKRYREDWCQWGRDVLGLRFTQDQRDLIAAVQRNRRTVGQSGHGCGKTFVAAFCGLAYLMLYKGSRVIMTSSSQHQVRANLWAEFRRLHRRAKIPLNGEMLGTTLRLGEKWDATAIATNDPSNIQGGHAEFMFVIIDEAHAVERGIWEALEGSVNSESSRMLAIFNPLTTAGPHYDATRRPEMWKLVKLSCLRHPNVVHRRTVIPGAVTYNWVEEAKQLWGEGTPLYEARVEGVFPKTSEDTLVSIEDLELAEQVSFEAWEMMLDCGNRDGTWLGVDVAYKGSDFTWLLVMRDRKVIHEVKFNGLDPMAVCGKIHEVCGEYDVPWDHVNVDGIGLGAGVVSRMREQDKDVNDVQFGASPVGDWDGIHGGIQFINRRAELYWTARTLLKQRAVKVPARFSQCWSDLMAHKYGQRSDGAVKIEPKEEVRHRTGRSPDASDALCLALARERNASPSLTFVG